MGRYFNPATGEEHLHRASEVERPSFTEIEDEPSIMGGNFSLPDMPDSIPDTSPDTGSSSSDFGGFGGGGDFGGGGGGSEF